LTGIDDGEYTFEHSDVCNELTQLSGFSEREMNNPPALCELAARVPNISACHRVKQVWLSNDRVFMSDLHCHALM